MSTTRRAWQASPAWVIDICVTVLVAIPMAGAGLAAGPSHSGLSANEIVFGLAGTLPFLVRRRWPYAVLVITAVAAMFAPYDLPYALPLTVAVYTIGAHRSARATRITVGAVAAAALAYVAVGGSRFDLPSAGLVAVLCAIAASLGRYIGGKRSSISTLEGETARLARERELLAERAVGEERTRIAQELHDVIAHNVSLIVVQAQALGATQDDARVSAATDAIADLGRRTMAEMHRTLRLLRDRDDAPELAPQPGLGDIEALLRRSREAGVPVELTIEGAPRPLAQSVDLSAYRIIQEALTNVVKHAGSAPAEVTIAYRADALELTILDSGEATANGGAPAPGGHGLIGMRERTALFGGTLTAGPRPGVGFEVHASLPYDERPA
jgi:signal transduction histidine kinase